MFCFREIYEAKIPGSHERSESGAMRRYIQSITTDEGIIELGQKLLEWLAGIAVLCGNATHTLREICKHASDHAKSQPQI
jgi:hypothetical protein